MNFTWDDANFSDIPPLTEEQLKAMRPMHEVLAEKGIRFQQIPGPHLVTIKYEDGSQRTFFLEPQQSPIILDPDIRKYFPDSETVNKALRGLIALIPDQ